jgi:hypothetical protein
LFCHSKFHMNWTFFKGHLSYKATFSWSQRWPLNIGLTVQRWLLNTGLTVQRWPRNTGLTVQRSPLYSQTCIKRSPLYSQTYIKRSPLYSQTCIKRSPLYNQTCIKRSPLIIKSFWYFTTVKDVVQSLIADIVSTSCLNHQSMTVLRINVRLMERLTKLRYNTEYYL